MFTFVTAAVFAEWTVLFNITTAQATEALVAYVLTVWAAWVFMFTFHVVTYVAVVAFMFSAVSASFTIIWILFAVGTTFTHFIVAFCTEGFCVLTVFADTWPFRCFGYYPYSSCFYWFAECFVSICEWFVERFFHRASF